MRQPRYYGADFSVDELVRMMEQKQITVPQFQRGFVWSKENASRFIEYILLGLPVSGLYMLEDRENDAYHIVDGHQRLRSLTFFYRGYWADGSVFALRGVDEQRLKGKTYESLDADDRYFLDNALIRATIFKVENPEDPQLFTRVFEIQNTAGVKLSRQEIELASLHDPLRELVRRLNEHRCWAGLVGNYPTVDPDQLILRFLTLSSQGLPQRPVSELVSAFIKKHNDLDHVTAQEFDSSFVSTMCVIRDRLGPEAFRVRGKFRTLLFDAVTIGIDHRLKKGPILDGEALGEVHSRLRDALIDREPHQAKAITSKSVRSCIMLGQKYFEAVP